LDGAKRMGDPALGACIFVPKYLWNNILEEREVNENNNLLVISQEILAGLDRYWFFIL
jgi:hypothetical protein